MTTTEWVIVLAVLVPFVAAEGYAIGRWRTAKEVVSAHEAHTASLHKWVEHLTAHAALVDELSGELSAYHADEMAHPLRPMVMTPLHQKLLDEMRSEQSASCRPRDAP